MYNTPTTVKRGLYAAVFALTSVVATPAQPAKQFRDTDVTQAVESDLWLNDEVPAYSIDVSTKDGIVTLSGTAYNLLARKKATQVAESIKGVRSVVDNIEVKPADRPDADIQHDVSESLQTDPATQSYKIAVDVHDGIVTLSGMVDSHAEKRLCVDAAERVRGVKDVHDNIELVYDRSRTDKEIEEEVEALLQNDVRVNSYGIIVQVKDGNVTLSGTVGSAAERAEARDTAWVAGVKSVNDGDLRVDWWTRDNMRRTSKYVPKSDNEIENAVSEALAQDPRLQSFEIMPDTRFGTVTLMGTVNNLAAKKAAASDAKNTVGVWRVKDYLKVKPKTYVSDLDLIANVNAALARDPYLNVPDISVAAFNGSVSLHGAVDSNFQRREAEMDAYRVSGVVDVRDYLTVRRIWPSKSDWAIDEDIKDHLYWDANLIGTNVHVNVLNGVATLSGNVDDWHEYARAAEDAANCGAISIKNNLRVNNPPRTVKY